MEAQFTILLLENGLAPPLESHMKTSPGFRLTGISREAEGEADGQISGDERMLSKFRMQVTPEMKSKL